MTEDQLFTANEIVKERDELQHQRDRFKKLLNCKSVSVTTPNDSHIRIEFQMDVSPRMRDYLTAEVNDLDKAIEDKSKKLSEL